MRGLVVCARRIIMEPQTKKYLAYMWILAGVILVSAFSGRFLLDQSSSTLHTMGSAAWTIGVIAIVGLLLVFIKIVQAAKAGDVVTMQKLKRDLAQINEEPPEEKDS